MGVAGAGSGVGVKVGVITGIVETGPCAGPED